MKGAFYIYSKWNYFLLFSIMYIALFIALSLACLILFIIYFYELRSTKKLKKCDLKDFQCHMKKMSQKNISEKERIIDYDKLYHKILLKAWYTGRFGDILKKEPKEIQNLNKIWELHKLRNYLVHEMWHPKWVNLKKSASDYKKEIEKIFLRFQ